MSPPTQAPAIRRFADRWAAELKGAVAPALTLAEIEELLAALTERLVDATTSTPFEPAAARDVGAALIRAHYRDEVVLRRTLEVLGSAFAGLLPADVVDVDDRMRAVQASLAEGYAAALRREVLAEQEITQHAALAAARAAEQRRRESDARFEAVFAGAAVGIGTVDMRGTVVDVNTAFAEMLGSTADEVRGRTIADVIGPENLGEAYGHFEKLRNGEIERFRMETPHTRRDGRITWIDLTMSAVPNDTDEPAFLIGVAVDITERRTLANQLWHEARHDPLTGLPNRKLYLERLRSVQRPIGLCFLDLDGFRSINDSLGHDAGDRVLTAVSHRLRAAVETPGCTVSRLGGDEFIVLIEQCASPDAATHTAEQMLAALRRPINVDGADITVTASVGVAHSVDGGNDPAQLMRAADIALSAAKAQGTGSWECYDPTSGERAVTRHSLATAMPAALARGEFFLHYQPIVYLATAEVQGFEALARWQHPRLGLVSPQRFIPIAEETGHIMALGQWVLAKACRDARSWLDDSGSAELYVSVNVAAAQVRQPMFVADILRTLDDAGLPARHLQLELTESAVAGDTRGAMAALHELAAAGVRLAVDDFGTGYSNLAHLGRLPVHQLKIDRSFLTSDGTHDKIVAATISLAHSLGLGVTAEGVETTAQSDRLQLLNCDNAQGWLYGRAVPATTAARRLSERQGRVG
jgi:diguanylate cyclase (GGDEF)-like protein/PAS domain S-box-containing protein